MREDFQLALEEATKLRILQEEDQDWPGLVETTQTIEQIQAAIEKTLSDQANTEPTPETQPTPKPKPVPTAHQSPFLYSIEKILKVADVMIQENPEEALKFLKEAQATHPEAYSHPKAKKLADKKIGLNLAIRIVRYPSTIRILKKSYLVRASIVLKLMGKDELASQCKKRIR